MNNEISTKLETYQKNLNLEDDLVLDNCKKLTSDLCDLFNEYKINVNYDVLYNNFVKEHLFYEHKANKNKYERDIEKANIDLMVLTKMALEEQLENERVNRGIESHHLVVDRYNQNSIDRNLDDLYYTMMSTLKRQIPINNDDMWYEIQSALNKSKNSVSIDVAEFRNQNSAILSNIEDIVKQSSLISNNSNEVKLEIDKIEKKAKENNNTMRSQCGSGLAAMLGYQFGELSKDVLLKINKNDQKSIKELTTELLGSITNDFNNGYIKFFNEIDCELIPTLIEQSKSAINNGKTVNFNNDEKANHGIQRISCNSSTIIGMAGKNSFSTDGFCFEGITSLIAKKYSIAINDPKYQEIESIVDKKMKAIDACSENMQNVIIEKTVSEIENQANKISSNTSLNTNKPIINEEKSVPSRNAFI